MSWKSLVARAAVVTLTVLLLLLGAAAPGAAEQPACLPPVSCSPPKPPPSCCVKLRRGDHVCSGTVVAATKTESLVVSCNHCFADRPWPGGKIPKGKYPAKCQIERLSDGATYDAVAVDGSEYSDVSLIVVPTGLEPCGIAGGTVAVGEPCEHWGVSSVHATGRITRYDVSGRSPPDQSERSTSPSIPGDSGAGVLVAGKLAAVNWGYWPGPEQGGTAVRFVQTTVRASGVLRDRYPDLWREAKGSDDLLPVPQPPVAAPVTPAVPDCPGGVCPVPPRPHHPFRLLPWRR